MKIRMIPVRNGRQDQFIEIGEDAFEILTTVWRRRGQVFLQPAGLDLRKDRKLLDPLKIVGDPIDDLTAEPAKFIRGHIAELCFFGRHKGQGTHYNTRLRCAMASTRPKIAFS